MGVGFWLLHSFVLQFFSSILLCSFLPLIDFFDIYWYLYIYTAKLYLYVCVSSISSSNKLTLGSCEKPTNTPTSTNQPSNHPTISIPSILHRGPRCETEFFGDERTLRKDRTVEVVVGSPLKNPPWERSHIPPKNGILSRWFSELPQGGICETTLDTVSFGIRLDRGFRWASRF